MIDKKSLSERDICTKFITPAIKQAGACQINGGPLKEAARWMEQYRVFWEGSFYRIEVYLKTVTTTKVKGKKL